MEKRVFDEVRRELLANDYGECLPSFLSGAIRGAGELMFTSRGFALTLRHGDREFVEKLFRIVCELTGEEHPWQEAHSEAGITKGLTYYSLTVPAESAAKLLEECEIVRYRCELITKLPTTLIGGKDGIRNKAYLSGLFLSCGYLDVPDQISDWRGGRSRCGYRMEFKLNSDIVVEPIKKLLSKAARIDPKNILTRKNGSTVYVKSADAISGVLAAMGSSAGVLALQEIIAERQMKNDVNRINNFDLANIDKSLSASEKQIGDIRKIDKSIGIDSLPPALADTCRMRLSYPDAGLEELGKLFDPPVGKSCINHRMRKLSAIAETL